MRWLLYATYVMSGFTALFILYNEFGSNGLPAIKRLLRINPFTTIESTMPRINYITRKHKSRTLTNTMKASRISSSQQFSTSFNVVENKSTPSSYVSKARTSSPNISTSGGTSSVVTDEAMNSTLSISYGDMDHHKNDERVKHILLLAYMRSGSTFLGELFNQNLQVFYWYEPLAALFDIFHKGGMSRNWFYHDDLSPRNYTQQESRMMLDTIKAIFTCNFTNIPRAIFKHRFVESGRSKDLRVFNLCTKKEKRKRMFEKTNSSIHSNADKDIVRHNHPSSSFLANRRFKSYGAPEVSPVALEKCIQELEMKCLSKRVRVVKTIRLRMTHIQHMTELLPSVEVVQIKRDPRGIINSRTHTTKRVALDYIIDAKILCRELSVDHQVLQIKDTPNLKFVANFEKFASEPKTNIPSMYKALDLKLSPEVTIWVERNTHARTDDGIMGTQRADPTFIAYKWSIQLPLKINSLIKSKCPSSFLVDPPKSLHEYLVQRQAILVKELKRKKLIAMKRQKRKEKLTEMYSNPYNDHEN